jgi:hypothetical protein
VVDRHADVVVGNALDCELGYRTEAADMNSGTVEFGISHAIRSERAIGCYELYRADLACEVADLCAPIRVGPRRTVGAGTCSKT